jgi:hypothetical protein
VSYLLPRYDDTATRLSIPLGITSNEDEKRKKYIVNGQWASINNECLVR